MSNYSSSKAKVSAKHDTKLTESNFKAYPGTKKSSLPKRIFKMRSYYFLLVPFLVFIIVFKYIPMYGVTLAFKDFRILDGIMGSPWAGLKYFRQLFQSFSFWEVLRNTLVISFGKLLLCFPVPIILSLFINEIRNERVKKTFQTFTYLPHFISWVIAASFLSDVLALKGPLNAIIQALGGTPVYFLADTGYFRWVIIISAIWKTCGWSSIVYIAAITGIDQQLYEAAKVDGAKRMKQIWHITLPGIKPTIITLFILEVGKIMSAGFDQIYNLYSPAVYKVADVLDTFTYRQGLVSGNYSFATAAGLFQNVIGFLLIIISNQVVNKLSDGEEGLW